MFAKQNISGFSRIRVKMLSPFLVFSESDYLIQIDRVVGWCEGVVYLIQIDRVVGWCEGVVYLTSLGCPADIGLQLGKACYPFSR